MLTEVHFITLGRYIIRSVSIFWQTDKSIEHMNQLTRNSLREHACPCRSAILDTQTHSQTHSHSDTDTQLHVQVVMKAHLPLIDVMPIERQTARDSCGHEKNVAYKRDA